MTQQDYEAAVAAFIRAKGVTRCPTACAVPTQASVAEADRQALRRRAEQREALREERKMREVAMYRFGSAA
jgi:stress response protein YsnF